MEELTSTSNEGSRKRNLADYKELNVKSIKEKDLDKALKLKGFEDLDIVCAIAFDVKENVKNLNSNSSSVSSSSANSKKFDIEEIREEGVRIGRIRYYTPENKEKIDRRRAESKKKKEAEKEARELEEAKELEELKAKEKQDLVK